MKKYLSVIISALVILLVAAGLTGCSNTEHAVQSESIKTVESTGSGSSLDEGGSYTSMSEVSAYLHEYGHLPDNYITKKEAKKLGWKTESGDLWDVAPGKSIGGDSFGNREGKLPKASGRKYYECDIDYNGGSRNAKRLVYSNDGMIFYTDDHYKTYTQVY